MHRNTAVTMAFLSVVAALLIGMNVGKKLAGNSNQIAVNPTSAPQEMALSPSTLPVVSPLISNNASVSGEVAGISTYKAFTSRDCGISYNYPANLTITEASNAARLINPQTKETIDMICGSNFPTPQLSSEKVEIASISGVAAKIYHDQTIENGGKPINILMFKHPTNQLDVAIMGFGDVFNQLLKTVKLITN